MQPQCPVTKHLIQTTGGMKVSRSAKRVLAHEVEQSAHFPLGLPRPPACLILRKRMFHSNFPEFRGSGGSLICARARLRRRAPKKMRVFIPVLDLLVITC